MNVWPLRKRNVRERVDERFRLYVERELPRRLEVAAPSKSWPAIGQFPVGRSAYVRRVELEGYGVVVVRAFASRRHLRRLAGYGELFGILTAHGVPAPRLLFVDDSAATLRTYGFWVLGEEFIEGRMFADLPGETQDRLILPVADLLARLHGIRHPGAGKPWEGITWEPRARARQVVAQWLGLIRRVVPELRRRRRRRLTAWFAAQVHARGRRQFPLVHSDVARTNLLLGRDGRLRLVDFERCAHWFPQYDLIVTEYSVCWDDPGRIAELRDRYFAANRATPALSRPEYDASRPLFTAWYHLRAAASRARRARRGQAAAHPGWEQLADAARSHWAQAEEFLRQAGAP